MKRNKVFSVLLCFVLVFTTMFMGTESALATENDTETEPLDLYTPVDYNEIDWDDEESLYDHVRILMQDPETGVATQDINITKLGHYTYTVVVIGTKPSNGQITIAGCGTRYLNLEYDKSTGLYVGTSVLERPFVSLGKQSFNVRPEGYKGKYNGEFICQLLVTYFPQSTKTEPVNVLNSGEKYFDNPGNGYSWFKIKTTGTRNLTIQFLTETGYHVRLYKADQETMLGGGSLRVTWHRGLKTYYAVPAGTYYVRVYSKHQPDSFYYGIKMTTSKVTEKSGATKAKAVNVGKNVLKKGTLLATETAATSADWYKATIKSDQKFYMHLNFKTGGIAKGGVKVSVYKKGSTNPMMTKKFASGTSSHDWKIYTKNNGGKLKKGTYYIKVQKYNYGTGYYSFKWNNKS